MHAPTNVTKFTEPETLLAFLSLMAHEGKSPIGARRDFRVDLLGRGSSQPQPPRG